MKINSTISLQLLLCFVVVTRTKLVQLYKRYYPGTNVERIYIKKGFEQWATNFAEYNPPNYTEHCNSTNCDSDDPKDISFNQKETTVDRKSWIGKYQVTKDNMPLNPHGRTGISGRGSLPLWGPNRMVMLIITRSPSLEEALVLNTNSSVINFPMGALKGDRNDIFPENLKGLFTKDMEEHYHAGHMDEIFRKAIKHSRLQYRGYFPDEQNTDNAWTELMVFVIMDKHINHLGLTKFDDSKGELVWRRYRKETLDNALHTLIQTIKLSMCERVRKRIRMTAWAVKHQGVSGAVNALNNVMSNVLTLAAIAVVGVQLHAG